ncbi:MAG: hypothetical protein ACPGID_02940 [Rubricella sp.]
MTRFILHVGTHKTGTTSFQNAMHTERGALMRCGLWYPDLGRGTAHHGLLTGQVLLDPAFHVDDPSAALDAIVDRASREDLTVLLSSEEFSRSGPQGARLHWIVERLRRAGPVQIVVTVRGQLAFLQSIYVEISRKAPQPPPRVFVETAMRRRMAAGLHLNHNVLLDHLEAARPDDGIAVLDYERARRHASGLFGSILTAAGLDPALRGNERRPRKDANVSAPALAVALANTFASPTVPGERQLAHLVRLLDEVAGDRSQAIFTRAERAAIDDLFAQANARFVARVRRGDPDFSLTTGMPGDVLHRDDLSRDLIARAEALFRDAA